MADTGERKEIKRFANAKEDVAVQKTEHLAEEIQHDVALIDENIQVRCAAVRKKQNRTWHHRD